MNQKKFFQLLFMILVSHSAGFFGSIFTRATVSTWYITLQKPFFNPPGWVFGPVWFILYTLMGISAYLVFQKGWKNKEVRIALYIFGIQLMLNALWSFLFFGLKSPLHAFFDIIVLWFAILLTIVYFYKVNKTATYLLIPYVLWVSFAAFLNISIVILN